MQNIEELIQHQNQHSHEPFVDQEFINHYGQIVADPEPKNNLQLNIQQQQSSNNDHQKLISNLEIASNQLYS